MSESMSTKLSNGKGRIIKNNPGMSWGRIKQIKAIVDDGNRITDLEHFEEDEVAKVVEQNKTLATQALMQHILEKQSSENLKLQQLDKYIKNYIAKLNKEGILGLYKILDYYKVAYSEYELRDRLLSAKLDLELEVESLYNILFSFLSGAVLLPDTAKQDSFNKEMDSILFNLEQQLEISTFSRPFILEPINPSEIFAAMINTNNFSPFGNEELNSDMINNFSYSFNLGSIDPEAQNEKDKYDEVAFTFGFYKVGEYGVDKKTFLKSLSKLGIEKEIEPGIFFVGATQKVNVLLEVSRAEKTTDSDGTDKERFHFTIYTEDKCAQRAEEYLDTSLYALNRYTDEIINNLYMHTNLYPNVQDRVIINYYSIDREKEEEEGGSTLQKGLETRLNNKIDTDKIESIKSDLGLDNLILEPALMEEIEELLDFYLDSAYYIENGVDFPKGSIFYGPPGNGKTLTAKIVAKLIDADFILISHDEIESKWVGESEKNIKKVFKDARARFKKTGKKQIIYLEEGDSLLEARGDQKNHKEGIVSVVLSELDGFDEESVENIFVLISTNRIEAIDPAVKRRFDKKIFFGLPNTENRVKHFKLNIDLEEKKSGAQVFDNDLDFDLLASKTKDKSGDFISKLIKNSKRKYFRSKKNDDNLKFIDTDFILERIAFTEGEEKNTEKVMGFNTDK